MVQINIFPRVPELDDTLRGFIQGFVSNSGEPELSVEKVYELMMGADRNDCIFFGISKDDVCQGYLFAEVMPDEYGEDVLLVQSTYVSPSIQENFWPDMVHKLGQFAKRKGCATMYFTTRRNPKAFARLLRTKWELDSYVMRHEFNHANSI